MRAVLRALREDRGRSAPADLDALCLRAPAGADLVQVLGEQLIEARALRREHR
jgi:hypothetical protein